MNHSHHKQLKSHSDFRLLTEAVRRKPEPWRKRLPMITRDIFNFIPWFLGVVAFCAAGPILAAILDDGRPRRNADTGFYIIDGKEHIPSEEKIHWLLQDVKHRQAAFDAEFGAGAAAVEILAAARGD